jgi:hypothetical protein
VTVEDAYDAVRRTARDLEGAVAEVRRAEARRNEAIEAAVAADGRVPVIARLAGLAVSRIYQILVEQQKRHRLT